MTLDMEPVHRTVLKNHHMDIVQDLEVTEDFIGLCYQEGLFDHMHIEVIKAEKISRQQAHKVLELLPRRGPEAFEIFVSILQHQYQWLSQKLTDSVHREREKESIEDCKPISLPKLECESVTPRLAAQRSVEDEFVTYVDQQVKDKVEQFYHKCFGLNRKMSTSDKKAIEKFLHDQIILERIRQQKSFNEDVVDANGKPDPVNSPTVIKQWLLDLHYQLKQDQNHNSTDGSDGHTIKTISFEVVESQISALIKRVHLLEEHIMSVHELFPERSRKKSPKSLVENVIFKYHELQDSLDKKQSEIDQMSQEIYELTMEKKKIQHDIQLKDIQLEVKSNQLNTLQEEKKSLKIDVDRLQKINQQHAEKEKTLSELQHMVEELRESRDFIKDENKSLKLKLESDKSPSRLSPRRSISFSKSNKPRGTGTRRRTSINYR